MKKVLDEILQRALEEAMASLATKAKAMVEEALDQVLRVRVQALLEGGEVSTPAPTRARVKARTQATLALTEEGTKGEGAKPRKRGARATTLEDDLSSILGGVKLALEKYRNITTPRGKELPDVLYRRVKRTLEHARENGRQDLAALARSALAYIHADPRGVAMGSWQALAAKLGLPVPIVQE